MNKLLKASVLFASCITLAACSGNDTSEGVMSDSQRALGTDISNGYYVSSIIVSDGAGQLMENVSVELNETERQLVYTRVYSEQNDSPALTEEVRQYNELNQYTGYEGSRDGVSYLSRNFQYDTSGRLSSSQSEFNFGTVSTQFSYSEDGKLASIEYDSNDLLHTEWEYTLEYGDSDNVEEVSVFVPHAEITTKTYYYYDVNNRLTRTEYDHDLDGGIDSSIGYGYNSEGNLSEKTEYGSDGSVALQSLFGYTATTAPVFNQSLFELKYFPQPIHFSESLLATFLNSE